MAVTDGSADFTPNVPGFVAGGSDDAARGGISDRHRTPAKARIVPLLHRREEGVHVDMDDLPGESVIHKRPIPRNERIGNSS